MSTEDRSAEEIRAGIEQTREEVGETVEALAAKSDVKGQARQRIDAVKANARARADEARAKARSVTPRSAQQGGEQVVAKVRSNPTPVIAGAALVAAFLVGRRTGRP